MPGHLEVAKRAALAAGKILVKYYGKEMGTTRKSDTQYTTEVDLLSEKTIKQIIKKAFPSYNIIAEESDQENYGSEYTWCIDPIDGTHNYMHGIPIFGVSIALLHKNEVIAGVIYLPLLKRMYSAERGKGAFMSSRRLSVSKIGPSEHYVLGVELGKDIRETVYRLMDRMKSEHNGLRAFASAVFNLCLLADGSMDAFAPLGTNLYDVGAGIIIVEEAGGKVTDINGKPWTIGTKNYLFTNGKLHDRMLQLIKKARI